MPKLTRPVRHRLEVDLSDEMMAGLIRIHADAIVGEKSDSPCRSLKVFLEDFLQTKIVEAHELRFGQTIGAFLFVQRDLGKRFNKIVRSA